MNFYYRIILVLLLLPPGEVAVSIEIIGKDDNNHQVASGLYFTVFKTPTTYSTIKMLLIK